MSLVNSDYPLDTEDRSFWHWLGGIGKAVLGNSTKFRHARQFTRINQRVILMDFSYGNLMAIAQNVPHLNTVISKGAEMFSNMKVKHVDKNGKEVKNSPILKLLNNPNPIDTTLESFLYKYYVNDAIYSSTFQYKNYGRALKYRGDDLPSLLWVLPSGEIRVELTGKIYRQTKIEDIILGYKLFLDPEMYTPDEVIYITEGISANGVTAGNRLEALQIPLSNIMAALKSNNIILTERGLIGFIGSGGGDKDADGALPFDAAERKRAEKDYQQRTSLDREGSHVTFTNANIKWIPMTFDVKQLMLLEGLEDAFTHICGAYGLDRRIFPESVIGKSTLSTTSDVEDALKATYQNTIQPKADKLMAHWMQHFGLNDKEEKLIADYSWLPVMQQDELVREQAFNQKVTALSLLLKDGVISHEQYAELAEVEMDGTGEVLQAPAPALPPANKDDKNNNKPTPSK